MTSWDSQHRDQMIVYELCNSLSTLATIVAEFGDCRRNVAKTGDCCRIRRQIVAEIGNYSLQCGQTLRQND